MVSIILTSAMALILAESNLPKPIKRLSYTLIHDRSKRFTVIWITFFFMCVATTLAVVSIHYICASRVCQSNFCYFIFQWKCATPPPGPPVPVVYFSKYQTRNTPHIFLWGLFLFARSLFTPKGALQCNFLHI